MHKFRLFNKNGYGLSGVIVLIIIYGLICLALAFGIKELDKRTIKKESKVVQTFESSRLNIKDIRL